MFCTGAISFITLMAGCVSSTSLTLPFVVKSKIVSPDRTIRVSDILETKCLAEKANPRKVTAISNLEIFQLKSEKSLRITHSELGKILSQRVPGLKNYAVETPDKFFLISYGAIDEEVKLDDNLCWKVSEDLKQGELLKVEYPEGIPCDVEHIGVGVRFDTANLVLRAGRDLPSGTLIPKLSERHLGYIDQGKFLTLVSKVGPVQVSRPVELLHVVKDDGVALVLTADDQIIRADIKSDAWP